MVLQRMRRTFHNVNRTFEIAFSNASRIVGLMVLFPLFAVILGCGPRLETPKRMKVAGVFSTTIEEPWVKVIHQALLDAERELEVSYDFTEGVGSADIVRRILDYTDVP